MSFYFAPFLFTPKFFAINVEQMRFFTVIAAFAVRLEVNVASMFIWQYCRTDKTKKRRFAFMPIRVNNRVPTKLFHSVFPFRFERMNGK